MQPLIFGQAKDENQEKRKGAAKKVHPLDLPNIDDYEWNSRWLQIEAERAGIDPTDMNANAGVRRLASEDTD